MIDRGHTIAGEYSGDADDTGIKDRQIPEKRQDLVRLFIIHFMVSRVSRFL